MPETTDSNIEDWLNRYDIQSVPDFDDKVRECEHFFKLLTEETDRNRFRWFLSGFLNAAYSFFESSALTAYFRYTAPDGETYPDDKGLATLRCHVKVQQNERRPNYVKTIGLTPLTKQLYDVRKKCTHHFSLSIMEAGPSLPEDFHLGYIQGDGTPALPLCRDVLKLVQSVHAEINE
jgi:hypothetical protein